MIYVARAACGCVRAAITEADLERQPGSPRSKVTSWLLSEAVVTPGFDPYLRVTQIDATVVSSPYCRLHRGA